MTAVQHLSVLPAFQGIREDDLRALVERTVRAEIPQGTIVMHKDRPAEAAILLLHGRMQAFVPLPIGEQVLGDISAGEVVGETALFVPGRPRRASVRAIQDSVALVLEPGVIEALPDNLAVVALQRFLLGTMARRMRANNLHIMKQWKRDGVHEQDDAQASLLGRLFSFIGGAA